jgi:acyl-CoA thioesterase I
MGLFRICTRSRGQQRRHAGVLSAAVLAALCGFLSMTGSAMAQAKAAPIRIVAYGDSLTAGFNLAAPEAFPAQLEKALRARGRDVEVINAGVSGDTTAAALERFDWAIPENADAAIVELGANDALRGQPPEQARRNLDTILGRLRAKGIQLLVAGIPAPRNWGAPYVKAFDPMFAELAQAHGALLYPFFLDGVALKPELSLPDGLHPNAAGVAVIVERIMPKVDELIARVAAKRAAAGKS